jgi:hypothetical protein
MDKYQYLTNGIINILQQNNRHNHTHIDNWDRVVLFARDNILYTKPEKRIEIAGHIYKVIRQDFLFRHHLLCKSEAIKLVDGLLDAGMNESEIEQVIHMWEDDNLKEMYEKEYGNFVGLIIAALLRIRLAGDDTGDTRQHVSIVEENN